MPCHSPLTHVNHFYVLRHLPGREVQHVLYRYANLSLARASVGLCKFLLVTRFRYVYVFPAISSENRHWQ